MTEQRRKLYRHTVLLDEFAECFKICTEGNDTDCREGSLLLVFHGVAKSEARVLPLREEYHFVAEPQFLRSLAQGILHELEPPQLSEMHVLRPSRIAQDFSSVRPWTGHRVEQVLTPTQPPADATLVLVVEHGECWELTTNSENPYAFYGSQEKVLTLARDILRALPSSLAPKATRQSW